MLTQYQIELIHREIDGANTPEESAALRSLIESDAEARSLYADLRHVIRLFDLAGETEPPPHLRQAILDALPQPAPAASRTESRWTSPRAIVRRSSAWLKLARSPALWC